MMRSAAAFLPAYMRLFMNFASTRSPYLASGLISRRSARRRRAMYSSSRSSSLGPLGAVQRTALPAVLHALGVEHAADDVIAHTGQVLDATAAQKHDRVLLQIVPLARDVTHDLIAIGKAYLGDLAERGIRLLWRRRVDARAYAALLRTTREGRHFVALRLLTPRLADQLVDRRHSCSRFAHFALEPNNKRGL